MNHGLVEAARLLASGATLCDHRERAIALLTLVPHHPASEAATRTLAQDISAASFSGKPADRVQRAVTQEKALALWPTVEILLLELDEIARGEGQGS